MNLKLLLYTEKTLTASVAGPPWIRGTFVGHWEVSTPGSLKQHYRKKNPLRLHGKVPDLEQHPLK